MAQPSPAAADTPRRPRLHTPGFSDRLGDRLLTFDNSTATSLELLRFKREYSDAPGFEAALRARVEQLSHLRHPSIGTVRGVEWLGAGEGLALVSHHTAGRRLSEVLQDARGPAFALELIRQLAPALTAIQNHARGVAHGLLTPDRIVVTREGRLVLVEHALASALDTLSLPARRLQTDFGIAMPAVDDVLPLDSRTDVVQIGFIALSLLLGRRLDPAGYPAGIPALLDEYAREDAATSARLRGWLERALQIGSNPFGSADEAYRAFEHLPEAPKAEPSAPPRPVEVTTPPVAVVPLAPVARTTPVAMPTPNTDRTKQGPPQKHVDKAARDVAVHQAVIAGASPAAKRGVRASNTIRWAVIALAVVAVAEGLIIAGRWLMAPVVVMGPTSPLADLTVPPAVPAPPPAVPAPAVAPPAPAPAPVPDVKPPVAETTSSAPPPAAPPPGGRFGGVRITSPIELQVFENGSLVGSTAGPIAIADGRHTFDLVNDTLGFRTRATVDVKAGQMAAVPVTLPNSRISINAAPWAEVSINGTPAGQTPLANMSIPIGTHEIVFRHPQLGERRHTVVVKAGEVTRVSASFQP